MDNKTWITQGTVDTPQSYNHYFNSLLRKMPVT